jgi:hypothetical protein
MTKQQRKAAVKAFSEALQRHDEATRLDDLEQRVRELEAWPQQFHDALVAQLPELAERGKEP